MSKFRLIFFLAFTAGVVFFIAYILRGSTFALLEPKGIIALQERTLMLNAVLLMLIVIIPVYILTFFFAWHYRASNTSAKYVPNWEHAKMDELIWWAIPFEIILVLGALTWTSTHALDPYKPLESKVPPITIQVVALDWKWLFIYPEQHIATVNTLKFPVNTPVNFRITSEGPMNSFWIPQLGGQIYAMTGMITPLSLMATEVGIFQGLSANYSGAGFSGMKFTAESVPSHDFDTWVRQIQGFDRVLDKEEYERLTKPSEREPVGYYGTVANDFFNHIVERFKLPPNLKKESAKETVPRMEAVESEYIHLESRQPELI